MNSPDFGATPVWQPQVSRGEADVQALPSRIFSEPRVNVVQVTELRIDHDWKCFLNPDLPACSFYTIVYHFIPFIPNIPATGECRGPGARGEKKQVRMPKQAGSTEGRELWPLDTNLLKTPVAGMVRACQGIEGLVHLPIDRFLDLVCWIDSEVSWGIWVFYPSDHLFFFFVGSWHA